VFRYVDIHVLVPRLRCESKGNCGWVSNARGEGDGGSIIQDYADPTNGPRQARGLGSKVSKNNLMTVVYVYVS
jgi:hypothetical protein